MTTVVLVRPYVLIAPKSDTTQAHRLTAWTRSLDPHLLASWPGLKGEDTRMRKIQCPGTHGLCSNATQ